MKNQKEAKTILADTPSGSAGKRQGPENKAGIPYLLNKADSGGASKISRLI
jgi:hypothetical protein